MPEKSKQHRNNKQSVHPHGELVAVGRVVKAKGLRGELKIESLSDIPGRFDTLRDVFIEFDDGKIVKRTIVSVNDRTNGLFVKLEGIDDRDAAEKFRGSYICVDSENLAQLPPDNFYTFDMEGMEVVDPAGNTIGTVNRVERYPANDVIVVCMKDGEVMIPAVKEYVRDVDLAQKRLTVDIPEGLPVYPKDE